MEIIVQLTINITEKQKKTPQQFSWANIVIINICYFSFYKM